MPKVLILNEPMPFYSTTDEDFFFRWLKSIPGVLEVRRAPEGLRITFDNVSGDTLHELFGLTRRYGLDPAALLALRVSKNAKWFVEMGIEGKESN